MRKRQGIPVVVYVTLIIVMVAGILLMPVSSRNVQAEVDWWQPTAEAPIHWQWQISTPFNANLTDSTNDFIPGVTVYDIDWEQNDEDVVAAIHQKGLDIGQEYKVIAYLEAGDWTDYREDSDQFPAEVIGHRISGWSDRWLDIRSPIVRTLIAARLDVIKAKGFDAVEPDCIDGYSNNTGFKLTYDDQIAYNTWIADECHARGLSVGLKCDIEQAGKSAGVFDWTLNEESYQYNEYEGLKAFTNLNKAVFEVEYGTSTPQASAMNKLHFNSMTRNLYLNAPGEEGYVRLPCIPDDQDIWPDEVSITFSLNPDPESITFPRGYSATFSITVSSSEASDEPVLLEASSSNSRKLKVSPDLPVVLPDEQGNCKQTFSLESSFAGSYSVTITGTRGTETREVTIPVVVTR